MENKPNKSHIYSNILIYMIGIYWFMQYRRMGRMGHAIHQFLFNNPCLQAVMTTIQNLALIICVWWMASSLSLWPLVHTSHYLSIKEHQHKPFIGSKRKGEAKKTKQNKTKHWLQHILSTLILVERYYCLDAIQENILLTWNVSLQKEVKAVIRLECAHFEL